MTKFSTALKLITSQLARHLALVFTGNIFSAGIGFLALLIISRILTISDYGLFNIVISVLLIVRLVANFGMNTTMMKFVSSYLGRDKRAEAAEVVRVSLYIKITISLIISVIVFFSAGLMSEKIFHDARLIPLFKLSSFGILLISIFFYVKAMLYAYKKFTGCVALQIFVDLFKLITILVLIFISKLNVSSAIVAFCFIPSLGIVLGLWQIRREVFIKKIQIGGLLRQLLSFSKWIFMSAVSRSAFHNLGLLMLARMLNSKAAGIYGLSLNLTYIFPIIVVSFWSVLLPQVSRFKEINQFRKYVTQSLKISLPTGIIILPLLFLSKKIILYLFGSRYLESVPIFNLLLLSFFLLTISSLIISALYAMNKPRTVAYLDLFSFGVMLLGCYFLIPYLGTIAPAMLALALNACTLGFLILYTSRLIRKGNIAFTHDKEAF